MLAREELLEQALALEADDRAFVADVLEQSLMAGPGVTPEIAAAWSQEIDRRIAAYDQGQTTSVDFDTAMDHMRQALAERRAARVPA
jgi:putative addiction module component (TIGR02574 family)